VRTGRGTRIHHNTIQVNGDGGSRPSATSLFESPLTLDSGDVAPGSTSNGHANLVGVTGREQPARQVRQPDHGGRQLLDGPDRHGPEQLDRGVRDTPTGGVRTYGSSPSTAGLTISGNTVYATTTAAGLTAGSGGHFVAP
jgi:hypothetical protein